MPRRRRLRRIMAPPGFRGYKPYGCTRPNEAINLNFEEYEALKLADYDLMNHEEAAKEMDVSRATFARIYESARRKMADALVNVKEIRTVFGNADLQSEWYNCNLCSSRFTLPATIDARICPVCNSDKVLKINKENFSK